MYVFLILPPLVFPIIAFQNFISAAFISLSCLLVHAHVHDQLTEDVKTCGYFMQNIAMVHTANNCVNVLAVIFGE
jgi:hypothetical protein